MVPIPLSSSPPLSLTIRLSSPTPTSHPIQLPPNSTIKDLKLHLEKEWDGKPKVDGITCVLGGRVLRDADKVGELWEGDEEASERIIHVIVKPSAWSEPFKTTPTESAFPTSSPAAIRTSSPTPVTPAPAGSLEPSPTSTAASQGYTPSYTAPPPPTSATSPPAITIDPAPAGLNPDFLANPFTPTPTTNPLPSLGPSVSGYPTYLAYVSQLIPLQRSLLLLNLQKAHYFYSVEVQDRLARLGWGESTGSKIDPIIAKNEGESEEDFVVRSVREKEKQEKAFQEGNGEVQEIRDLLVECGLWGIVMEREEEAEQEVKEWGPARIDPRGQFQVIQIGGLPFLLDVPDAYRGPAQGPPPLTLYKSLKRGQAIVHILTTMLQLLICYQPTAPALAYGRALLRPPPAETGARAHRPPAVPPIPARPIRRATLSIVINLEAILSTLIPLLLLSLKLGFLLWIFGRHASSTKRMILFGMAAIYVIWEGWAMQRRRAGAGRDRIGERRRAAGLAPVGVPAGQRAPPGGVAGAAPRPAAAGGDLRRRGAEPAGDAAAPRARRGVGPVPQRAREPTSRLTPRYWLNWIAAIGLAEEARELGLTPRTIAGRPVTNPRTAPQPNDRASRAAQARRRAVRTAIVGIVLFFGTLSPEVEKKRKRALEKRERLLAQRLLARERRAAAATGNGPPNGLLEVNVPPGSGTSTPGVFEADQTPIARGEEAHATGTPTSTTPSPLSTSASQQEAGPSTSASPPAASSSTSGGSVAGPSSATSPPAGRAVISDAELFRDGLGEAHQAPTGEDVDQQQHELDQAEEEGRLDDGGELETDDEDRGDGDGDGQGEVDEIVALF